MSSAAAATPSPRLGSIDAFRGFVMLLMMAEVLESAQVARALPGSFFWHWFALAQTHVEWVGCSLHDLIQPAFSFLVGVALPFSIASRQLRGQSRAGLVGHACLRALALILLGVFLRSIGHPQTNWTFEDTLTQIGLGYPWLVLFGLASPRVQWLGFALLLVGYWAAWALYPVADSTLNPLSSGVPTDWPYHANGFAAHWNKNANLGARFDQWFLNLFPRSSPFVANSGGYLTLSFIPTLGTMLLGLIAGQWLRAPLSTPARVRRMIGLGVGGIALGLAIHFLGLCPIVKRIWTPSWTLFSGGCCSLMLLGFHLIIDVKERRSWAFPLRVIGVNSLAAYCIAHLFGGFVSSSLDTHLGANAFSLFGAAFAPFVRGVMILIIFWLILLWMYRRKLFLKL